MEWQVPGRHAAESQLCTERWATGLEKNRAFGTKVLPGSLWRWLQSRIQGMRAQARVSLSGGTPGSFWHALGMLQRCQLAPTRGSCVPIAPGTSLQPAPSHVTAVTPLGQAPASPGDRESSMAACAHTTHPPPAGSLRAPTRLGAVPVPHPRSGPLSSSPHGAKTLMNNSHHENKLCSLLSAWRAGREHLLEEQIPARGRTKPSC